MTLIILESPATFIDLKTAREICEKQNKKIEVSKDGLTLKIIPNEETKINERPTNGATNTHFATA